jgi:hypothetical protein
LDIARRGVINGHVKGLVMVEDGWDGTVVLERIFRKNIDGGTAHP